MIRRSEDWCKYKFSKERQTIPIKARELIDSCYAQFA